MRDNPVGPSVRGVDSDSAASGTAETPLREVCSGGEAEPAGALANTQNVLPPKRDAARLHACTRVRVNLRRSQ